MSDALACVPSEVVLRPPGKSWRVLKPRRCPVAHTPLPRGQAGVERGWSRWGDCPERNGEGGAAVWVEGRINAAQKREAEAVKDD